MRKYTLDDCRAHLQLSSETLAYRQEPSWVALDSELQSDITSIFCIEEFLDEKNISTPELKTLFSKARTAVSTEDHVIDNLFISNLLSTLIRIIQQVNSEIINPLLLFPSIENINTPHRSLSEKLDAPLPLCKKKIDKISCQLSNNKLSSQTNKAAHTYVLSRAALLEKNSKILLFSSSETIKFLSTETIEIYTSHVLTVFNHGTGGSSEKSARSLELINLIGNQFEGAKEITEGVASISDPDKIQYFVDEKNRLQKIKIGSNSEGKRLWNNIRGHGMKNNVDNLLIKLRWLKNNNRLPTVINMTGWSRGGVTSIRQANAIAREFPDIKINIFAIDPVGGFLKNFSHDNHNLPINVQNFTATLAENEKRLAFAPIDKSFITHTVETNVTFLPFPGIHRDLAKFDNDSGKVNADLLMRFLGQHGSIKEDSTLFKKFTISDEEKTHRYRSLQSARNTPNEYALNKDDRINFSNTLKKQIKSGSNFGLRINADKYTDHPKLFLNKNHEALFKQRYPNVYAAYFEGKIFIDRTALEQEYTEIPDKEKRQLEQIHEKNPVSKTSNADPTLPNVFENNFDHNNANKQRVGNNKNLDKFIQSSKENTTILPKRKGKKLSAILSQDYNLLVSHSVMLRKEDSLVSRTLVNMDLYPSSEPLSLSYTKGGQI